MVQLFYRLIKIDILDYKSILNYHPIALLQEQFVISCLLYIYIYIFILNYLIISPSFSPIGKLSLAFEVPKYHKHKTI